MAQGNFLQSLFNRGQDVYNQPPLQMPAPQLQDIMINQQGQQMSPEQIQSFYAQPQPQRQPQQGMGAGIVDALFGQKAPQQEVPTQIDPDSGMIVSGAAQNPRTGGLISDITSGFQENANTPFNMANLEPQKDKGFATQLGEGLGTLGRFAASPTGRGLLAAGVAGLTGGSPISSISAGLTAGVGNQQARTQDQFYRNQLQSEGVDTSNIQGYVTPEMYKNQSLGQYRVGSLAIREQLGLLGDNTRRAGLIAKALNEGSITPQEARERMQEYGITLSDMAKSNQTRNADVNQYLAPAKKYAYETAPQIAMGNYELNRLKADPTYQAEVAGAEERAKKQASNYSEDVETYNTYKSKMPELKQQVANLNELAKTASYTKLGVAGDTLTRELGLPVGKGAVARTEYTAVINNQILPLLRETFGAQFTEREGESLRQSLGDVNKSPAEKQAVLNSFIRQKEMNIQSQARKINQYGGGNVQPFTPNANLTPIPQSAFGGGAVRPRQTSKPKAPTKGAKEKTYYF